METKNRSKIAKPVLNKNNVGGITMFNFKLYYIAIMEKWAWYQQRNRHVSLQNIRPRYSPHNHTHLILPKRQKPHSGGKTDLSSNDALKTGYEHVEDWN